MFRACSLILPVLVLLLSGCGNVAASQNATSVNLAPRPAAPQHFVVWKEEGRFGGWPANGGVWSWGNEVLVGFTAGHFKLVAEGHAIDEQRGSQEMMARSLDGGRTWQCEPFTPQPPGQEGLGQDGLNFADPNVILRFRDEAFFFSRDRGHTWRGPVKMSFEGIRLQSRTDYIIDGPRECTAFLTAAKRNGAEGRPLCVRTTDGGRTWTKVSWIGPEPRHYAIMPASVRLSPQRLVSIIRQQDYRSQGLPPRGWFPVYRSDDNGQTWDFLGSAADIPLGTSNPPSLLKLPDGRLCLVYGYRAAPFGLRMRFSRDDGKTWSGEIILRRDGGTWDLGYARTVLRPDGKLLTIYYHNDRADKERYIAATLFDPNWAAPEITLSTPASIRLPAGAGTYRLEVQTDMAAQVRYAKGPNVPFDRMPGRFDTTGGTSHAAVLTGLADGGVTDFYIKAAAADGSESADDVKVTLALADGTKPLFYVRLNPDQARLTEPMALFPKESSAPAGYLSTPQNEQGAAAFTFSVPRKGTYFVWGWVFAHSWREDSFAVAVDDGPSDFYDITENRPLDTWRWFLLNGRKGLFPLAINPRTFSLEAGEHTIHFNAAEKNARLGGVIITDDPYFVPDSAQAAIPEK